MGTARHEIDGHPRSRHRMGIVKTLACFLAALVPWTCSRRVAADESSAGSKTPATNEGPGVDVVQLRVLRMETRRWKQMGMYSIPEEDTFDDWAFGSEEGARRFRRQLDGLLDAKLRDVRQVYDLSPIQERKLRLAGRGDLQRLIDLVDDARREFEGSRTDAKRLGQLDIDLRLVELRATEDPFGLGSLFAKTLWKMRNAGELVAKPRKAVGGKPSRPAQ